MAKSSAKKKVKKEVAELQAKGLLPAYAIVAGDKAKVYAKEFERINKVYGELKPEYIVQEAKKADNVLHDWPGWNGWDKNIASEKYWRQQANRLKGYVECTVVNDMRIDRGPVKAFVTVSTETGHSIVGIFDALSIDAHRLQLVRRELATIRGCKERLRNYKEFGLMLGHLDEALEAGESAAAALEKKPAKKAKKLDLSI